MDETTIAPFHAAVIERLDIALQLGLVVSFVLLLTCGFLLVRMLRS